MKPLTVQDLRHRVTIKRPVKTADGKGGKATTWSVVNTVFAEVIGLDGRESVMQHVLEGRSVYRVRIRWRDDIRSDWQLRYGTIDLNITAPPSDPDGRREQLVIMATSASALKTA